MKHFKTAALALLGAACLGCKPGAAQAPLTSVGAVAPLDARAAAKILVVAQDGSGDFKTVQEAIAAIPDQSATPTVVHLKRGTYQGQIIVPAGKNHVRFEGGDFATTILTFAINTNEEQPAGINPRFKGTGVVILGDDFQAQNLTFQNTSGDHGQALALRIDGDRAIVRNCRLLGWQDTLMVNKGRQYFRDCYIEGRVDFIYGSGTTVFDRCEIRSKNGGHITAANTPEEQPFGFVFLNCNLTSSPEPWIDPATGQPPAGRKFGAQADLGRPWRPYANVVYINSQMGDHIKPVGWDNWRNPENEKTARYAEYGSRQSDTVGPDGKIVVGAPLDLSKRAAWAKGLSASEAAKYSIENVFGGWNPNASPSGAAPGTAPVAAVSLVPISVPATTQTVAARPVFVLAGDSTVTDDAGWGAGFKALLKPNVSVVNLARGGRSSRSFRDEGSWQKVLDLRPQYVLIQFGHNDDPGHGPDREAAPDTVYKRNIERYVDEARAAGITPILVTPMTRRQFDKTGKIRSSLAPYALAVKHVAVSKKVPLVDLHARSLAFFNAMGPEKTKALAPVKAAGVGDGTHLNALGSAAIAPLVADELKWAVPAVAGDF